MSDLQLFLFEQKQKINLLLETFLPSGRPEQLADAMRYAVFAGGGGKRIRPILTLLTAEALGDDPKSAGYAAAAVELFHTYTLVHDDLPAMDDDEFRRGVETVHKKYGEWTAILAGDALQALAFSVLAKSESLRFREMVRLLASVGQTVVDGQAEDILYGAKATENQLFYIHLHKTADLIATACGLGALAVNTDPTVPMDFGRNLGLAFQIVDDLLDADPAELSIVNLMDRSAAERLAGDYTRAASSALERFPGGSSDKLARLAGFLLARTV